ncbi:DUF3369 domain-containing protein [Massilia sp. BJB1822]|uniref:DUF3369 domain-containing protein n=1 Tax=Massilia sp. BJB1822 TaxID=2744470 RepID=UPI00159320A8|nr:DUF3369 domain-containing protein [Massilia sp. BJB1822]NVD99287.1 DUF3369 domain-containing protein [Massilia sp. BJB1822]
MDDDMLFDDEAEAEARPRLPPWQVLIVDDEEAVHQVTKLVMSDFEFDGRPLQFTDCYSGAEAREVLGRGAEFALILLDVVMESEHAGLDLVRHIREELGNISVRIVLRTGQPGQAPQAYVLKAYDINDYREKTDLTHAKLSVVFYSALRGYRDLMRLERARSGLRRTIDAITQVCEAENLPHFCSAVLDQAGALLGHGGEGVCASRVDAYAAVARQGGLKVLAVTPGFAELQGESKLEGLPPEVRAAFERCMQERRGHHGDLHHASYHRTRDGSESFLYMAFSAPLRSEDRELLSLFSANVAVTYEKLQQREETMSTSKPVSLFEESDGRILAEAALRSITASTARARGEDFLRILVRDLGQALDVRYVIAGRVIQMADGEGIRTLAVWGGEDYLPNMDYSLKHTPCQDVTDQSMCFHGCGIQADYPEDTLLVDMQAESYIGMPMVDTEGKTLGILSALDTRPIDENKRLLALSLLSIFAARCAAELQHQDREALLEEKVQQRTEALRAAQANMVEQEKMAALGALVAGVAHEVNTPVGVAVTAASGLASYAEQMVGMLSGEKVSRSELTGLATRLKGAAGLVEQNLARAAQLIGNFKQLAVDQGTEHISELVLHEYVQGVVSAHSPELRKAQIEVKVDIAPQLRVRLPAGKFSQVLSNLLMNSAKHAYPNGGPGQVQVAARLEEDEGGAPWLQLHFADDGIGLAPGIRERVFEPFFTTKRGQGGSGLGMHIVYTIVHQMGGQVALDEQAQRGCALKVKLPLARFSASASAE